MTEKEIKAIKNLRNAVVLATSNCVENGVPKQNVLQFLSLINAAIIGANELIGEDREIEHIRSKWKNK